MKVDIVGNDKIIITVEYNVTGLASFVNNKVHVLIMNFHDVWRRGDCGLNSNNIIYYQFKK